MKLGIYSHCAIDTIVISDSTYEQVGGAACYAGLTARKFKFDVELYTKFGPDFNSEDYLVKNKMTFPNGLSEKNTTRFKITINGSDRDMVLENSCEPLEYVENDADGYIVSPIFDEMSAELFAKIKQDSKFLFLDPQGFLRRKDQNNNVFLDKTNLDLSNVSAIKVGVDEISNIVGTVEVDSMKSLQKQGVQYVLHTDKKNISMLVEDKLYSLTLPNKEIYDTTGIGDIFCSTFTCTMLKEKDFLWAFCFAGGSAQAALDTKQVGLEKVPEKGATQINASYFYNTVKFRQV